MVGKVRSTQTFSTTQRFKYVAFRRDRIGLFQSKTFYIVQGSIKVSQYQEFIVPWGRS
jgi:hypothetical protein